MHPSPLLAMILTTAAAALAGAGQPGDGPPKPKHEVPGVQPDGTASIVYAFGPMGSNTRRPGGVLHGIGVILDGELRFQNSDGSQFAFRPLYADLDGRLTTPQGQNYQAVFKKTL